MAEKNSKGQDSACFFCNVFQRNRNGREKSGAQKLANALGNKSGVVAPLYRVENRTAGAMHGQPGGAEQWQLFFPN